MRKSYSVSRSAIEDWCFCGGIFISTSNF